MESHSFAIICFDFAPILSRQMGGSWSSIGEDDFLHMRGTFDILARPILAKEQHVYLAHAPEWSVNMLNISSQQVRAHRGR
jgi:hypothetical protein